MTGVARTVLVTGGAGFIGAHACRALARAGLRPVAYDNLSTGHGDLHCPLIRADIRETARLTEALAAHRVDTVMHFAASAYVGDSVRDPALYYDNNVGGMISLLAAMRGAGVGRIVFSSSCATYGIPDSLPVSEATPQRPINPYGRTKLICEMMLADHAAAYGLRHVTLRYFNAAGADPDGSLRERHNPETHLIPLALMAAAGTGAPLAVFGTDWPTPDGTCVRDYIHVSDLARAHVLALAHLDRGGDSVALNLGSGRGHSVRDILTAIEDMTGCRVPVVEAPRRPGDPPVLVADPSRAATVLGFRTEQSDLGTILGDAAPTFGLEPAHV